MRDKSQTCNEEKVMSPAFSAFVTPNPFDQLHEPPPPYTPSPPAPASFSQPARVSSLPIFPAPLFTPFPSVPVSAPDLLSHESPFRTRVLSAPVEPFLFGRKALQPPLLTMFSRQIFRPWLDRFTEFLERFNLAHYILPHSVLLRDNGTTEVLLVLYQALAAAEDATPAGRLLTTMLGF